MPLKTNQAKGWGQFYELFLFPKAKDALCERFSCAPISSIFDHVQELNCRTVLVETRYIDLDYRNEYSNFYSKTFTRHRSTCERLHFFRKKLSNDAIPFLRLDSDEDYLGFCVIRPIPQFRVGRTILTPINRPNLRVCQAKDRVNLFGEYLSISGMPFIQQDTQVGACAQASVWMALNFMHLKEKTQRVFPYEITQYATKSISLGREIPSEGLTADQIAEAVRGAGLSPLYRTKEAAAGSGVLWRPEQILQVYLDSQIPVIISIKKPKLQHAVVAVGLETIYQNKKSSSFSDCIKSFIVNDDARGPYKKLPVVEKGTAPYSVKDIDAIIVPLPQKVYLTGEEAEEISEGFLNSAIAISKRSELPEMTSFKKLVKTGEVISRTFVIKSNDYKNIFGSITTVSKHLQRYYKLLPMSRYIWVTELTSKSLLFKNPPRVYGEIIVDATSNKYNPNFLAIHLPSLLILKIHQKDPHPPDFKLYHIKRDDPHPSCAPKAL